MAAFPTKAVKKIVSARVPGLFRSGTRALLAWFRSRFSGTPIGPMSFGRLSAAAARLFPRRAALVRRCSSGGGPLALDGLLIPKAFVESEMPAIVDLFSAFAVPGQSERELDAGGRAAHSPCAPAPVAARPHASRPRQPLRAAANSMPTPCQRLLRSVSLSVCLSVRLQKVLAAVGEHPSPETLHRMFVEADTARTG